MSSPRPTRLNPCLSLTLAALWLLASGCASTERTSSTGPEGAGTATLSSTNPAPVELEGDQVMIRGTLNGHEVRLVLDTGASHVVVSPEAAAAAGIPQSSKVRFGAFGDGQGSARRGVADAVAVGPAVAEKVAVAIIPIPAPLDGDGLLGLSFLRRFVFRLDYDRKLVTFALPLGSNFTSGASSVPLEQGGPMLVVQAEVDGIPARLIVDTGGGQALLLRSWFVDKHHLRERHLNRLGMVTGAGLLGQMHGEIARLQTLKLGDYTVTNVFTEFEPKTKIWPGDFAGFIGAPFLRKFNLTVDVTGRRLWLEPNASFSMTTAPPAAVRSGFACLPEGTNWIVQDLIPDSPAAEAGVRLGDQLLEINGVPVQSLKFAEVKRAFQAAPGTRVRVRLEAKGEAPREVTITLRDLL